MGERVGAHTELPKVLHISADVPDLIVREKTPVIGRLIELVEKHYDHRIISLNRRAPSPTQMARILAGAAPPIVEDSLHPLKSGECLAYLAPPKGVFHATMLDKLAEWIIGHLRTQKWIPDLVVGHKLTIEGLVAQTVAQALGIPFAVTVQGNTDQKILSFRRDLTRRCGSVYHEAACVFSFAPWARRSVEQVVGERTGLTLDLPCPTAQDLIREPVLGREGLISVFHLRHHAIKNLSGVVSAVRSLNATGRKCTVQVYGGGTSEDQARCLAIIGDAPTIHLMGPRTQDELGAIMNSATALVLPSQRESFGLVFIEALFAGLPIIYPRGASIDGYFDDLPFAIPVDARRTRDIQNALRYAIDHERQLKAALAQWQKDGGLERFSRPSIAETFRTGLDHALRTAQGTSATKEARCQ